MSIFSQREKKGPAPKAWEDEGLPFRVPNPSPSQIRWAPPSPFGRGGHHG